MNVREIASDARGAFRAGTEMTAAVDTAGQSLTEFVRFVSLPRTNAAAGSGKPLDISQYGQAAVQTLTAAPVLNELLTTTKASTPHLTLLIMQASSDPNDVVRRATRSAILLIVLLLVGSVVASTLFRLIARRWPGERPKKPAAVSPDPNADGEHDKQSENSPLKPRI